jgi:D-alanyl-D-alanine carboxypeptidase
MNGLGMDSFLDTLVGSRTPGLQYSVLNAARPVFQYNSGQANIRRHRQLDSRTTLNAYSMSKTITAAALLLLVERRQVQLDDPIERYLGRQPYAPGITTRQLLTHTSGVPNPLPLRWVHSASRHDSFNEKAALATVLRKNPRLSFAPGTRFAYSNIGYWLLGEIVARTTSCQFTTYVTEHVLRPLGAPSSDLSYTVPDFAQHAQGYLEKYSFTNVFKRFLIDSELIGDYDGRWLTIMPHYVNGPAFGGLIGTSRGFGYFLQDQLRSESVLLNERTKGLFYTQQRTSKGDLIPMTLGWHMGSLGKFPFFFKEGGGGGFHCMMRVYREAGIATIAMANARGFDIRGCMDAMDIQFL